MTSSGVDLLDLIRTVEVTTRKGKLPTGKTLPTAAMTGEFSASGWDTDNEISDTDFDLRHFVEAQIEVSFEAVLQSSVALVDDLLEALRLAISERILQQIVSGDGQGHNLSAVTNAYRDWKRDVYERHDAGEGRGVHYGGDDHRRQLAELRAAWILGRTLSHGGTATTAIEPGASSPNRGARPFMTLTGNAVTS